MALGFFRCEDLLGPGIYNKGRNTAVLEQGDENIDLDRAALVESDIEDFGIHAPFETPHDLEQRLPGQLALRLGRPESSASPGGAATRYADGTAELRQLLHAQESHGLVFVTQDEPSLVRSCQSKA